MKATYLKPLLPLRDIVIFPSMVVPLFVGREKSIKALQEVMKSDKSIVLVTQKNSEVDDPSGKDLYQYGCLSKVLQLLKLPDGTVKVLVEGEKRIKIVNYKEDNDNYLTCEVEIADDENVSKDLSYEPDLDMHFGDNYVLEVSTPGIDRKFFDIDQLNSFIGEELEFRTKELVNGSRKFSGKLVNCNTEEFSIENHKGSDILKFKFTELDSCKLKPNYKNLI